MYKSVPGLSLPDPYPPAPPIPPAPAPTPIVPPPPVEDPPPPNSPGGPIYTPPVVRAPAAIELG